MKKLWLKTLRRLATQPSHSFFMVSMQGSMPQEREAAPWFPQSIATGDVPVGLHMAATSSHAESVTIPANLGASQPVGIDMESKPRPCGEEEVHLEKAHRKRRRLLRAASSLAPDSQTESPWVSADALDLIAGAGKESNTEALHAPSSKTLVQDDADPQIVMDVGVSPTLRLDEEVATTPKVASIAEVSVPDALMDGNVVPDSTSCKKPGVIGDDDVSMTGMAAANTQGAATSRPRVPRLHVRRRLIGKQAGPLSPAYGGRVRSALEVAAPQATRSQSAVARACIGHVLKPPETGCLVKVHGDGWGGASSDGQAAFLATVTEADARTFTVIRRGDVHGAWEETHVLKDFCVIVARTSSQEQSFWSRMTSTG
mmetsp:Transcript_13888/g.31508  ORF Transcript_13888/g.31508 Transcript_13888/m.31508 type:complete len:371 (+) Transcript_13888:1-1113(+)